MQHYSEGPVQILTDDGDGRCVVYDYVDEEKEPQDYYGLHKGKLIYSAEDDGTWADIEDEVPKDFQPVLCMNDFRMPLKPPYWFF